MMLMPDEHIAAVYQVRSRTRHPQGRDARIRARVQIHYGQVMPREDLDVVMIAPKAPGHTVRSTYAQAAARRC